jgi:hypothetical protein
MISRQSSGVVVSTAQLAASDQPGRKNTALMAAYFDDVCWDGEPIESAAVVPAMESVPA